MNTLIKVTFFIYSIFLFSCSTPSQKEASTATIEKKSNEVVLSDEQFKSIKIQLGSVESRSLKRKY